MSVLFLTPANFIFINFVKKWRHIAAKTSPIKDFGNSTLRWCHYVGYDDVAESLLARRKTNRPT